MKVLTDLLFTKNPSTSIKMRTSYRPATLMVAIVCANHVVDSFHLRQFSNDRHRRSPNDNLQFKSLEYVPRDSSFMLQALLGGSDSDTPKQKQTQSDTGIKQYNLGSLFRSFQTTAVSAALGVAVLTGGGYFENSAIAATDPNAIVGCLFQKCAVPLAKCIASPKCLANVVCINTCNDRPDEIDCQIRCGDIFDNPAIAEFNKCAVSDMSCVPQQPDTGLYPVPSPEVTVPKFNTNFFNGRLYITAGQNPLFDIFPCQVHFFTETEPGKFFGKLNWRVSEPDGEFFTRDALQEFYQDPKDPSHLINHDNEYLHYKDDWWIIDFEYDNNEKGIPPFAFVYYRGSNDAWDGYGGAVIYTRDAALPMELLPRLRAAAKKINFDFDKDFVITDNSCPAELSEGEKVLLREKFAGKVVLQTEEQLQAAATRLRGNAVNSVKAQKLFFENRFQSASDAFQTLEQNTKEFEREIKDAAKLK